MGDLIYLDNNATTKPLDEVVAAMAPYLGCEYANPSSVHVFGQRVRHAVEVARETVAALVGGAGREIVFTGNGTEAINLAIRGVLGCRRECHHVVTSAVEHSAVKRLCERLAEEGYEIEEVGVDGEGRLDVGQVEAAIRDDTALVTLMHANNETGVMLDVEAVADVCAGRGVPLHVDAVQTVGKVAVDVSRFPVTLMSMSAHKFHGPKGVGALFVRRRTRLSPLVIGGRQEGGSRGGTENVAGIVGMAAAAKWAVENMDDVRPGVRSLRDRLEEGILSSCPSARVIGGDALRMDHTTNIGFEGVEAEAVLILLSGLGICASSGSACSSGSLEPSHVLAAMGVDPRIGHGAIRFSLSHLTTRAEIDAVVQVMPSVLSRLGSLNRG